MTAPASPMWIDDAAGYPAGESHRIEIDEIVWSARTPHQQAIICHTPAFGRVLMLDGVVQSSERDEHIYHEALVHPAMIAAPQPPRRVLIVGGGEGAVLREVLKHRSVEKATMVDLDEEVVRACQTHMPAHGGGAFDDPRAELIFGDGMRFLRESRETFDCMIVDVNDADPGSISGGFYAPEFHALARSRLSSGGTLATLAASPDPRNLSLLAALARSARQVFAVLNTYVFFVPVFGSPWAYFVMSQSIDAGMLTAEEVDRRLAGRVAGPLRLYDGETHLGMFRLPRYLRAALGE